MNNDLWYKVAVSGPAFKDNHGDEHAGVRGLIGKLDYLQTLGVDCLWLLLIYPSPLHADGYDIADYHG
jgi:glycosidase